MSEFVINFPNIMNYAIIYALCNLVVGAANDFVFKLFTVRANATPGKTTQPQKRRSCGMFICISGIVFTILLFAFQPPKFDTVNWGVTIPWSVFAGFLSVLSNALLIESMNFQSAGIASTIFRMNMVLVVLGAWLFLGEPLTVPLLCGSICAITAILAFLPRKQSEQSTASKARLGFVLAVLACILRAGMSLSYKGALEHGTNVNLLPTINGICWIVFGAVYALLREHSLKPANRQEVLIGIVSGIFIAAIVFFMARMNACGDASKVNPIAQMSFLGTFVLSVIFLKEKVNWMKIAAVILGCAAIVFLAL